MAIGDYYYTIDQNGYGTLNVDATGTTTAATATISLPSTSAAAAAACQQYIATASGNSLSMQNAMYQQPMYGNANWQGLGSSAYNYQFGHVYPLNYEKASIEDFTASRDKMCDRFDHTHKYFRYLVSFNDPSITNIYDASCTIYTIDFYSDKVGMIRQSGSGLSSGAETLFEIDKDNKIHVYDVTMQSTFWGSNATFAIGGNPVYGYNNATVPTPPVKQILNFITLPYGNTIETPTVKTFKSQNQGVDSPSIVELHDNFFKLVVTRAHQMRMNDICEDSLE